MSRAIAIFILATAACVSPIDYGNPVADTGVDGPASVDAPLALGQACNFGGHDEDGDCIADKPDLCPMLAGDVQHDTDRDGIGDDCDPRNGDNDDVEQNFLTFDALDVAWTSDGVPWNIGGDALSVNLMGASGGADYQVNLIAPFRLVAEVEVLEQGQDAEVSLFAEYSPGQHEAYECVLRAARDGQTGQLLWTRVVDGERVDFEGAYVAEPMFPSGQRFQIAVDHGLDYDPNSNVYVGTRCSYSIEGRNIASIDSPPGIRSGNGKLRLAARDVRLSVAWVVYYDLDY